MEDITKQVAPGVIEACASMICDQIRIARIDASAASPQQRMTMACLMDQLRRITEVRGGQEPMPDMPKQG